MKSYFPPRCFEFARHSIVPHTQHLRFPHLRLGLFWVCIRVSEMRTKERKFTRYLFYFGCVENVRKMFIMEGFHIYHSQFLNFLPRLSLGWFARILFLTFGEFFLFQVFAYLSLWFIRQEVLGENWPGYLWFWLLFLGQIFYFGIWFHF